MNHSYTLYVGGVQRLVTFPHMPCETQMACCSISRQYYAQYSVVMSGCADHVTE